jgi:hypothetical protein
VREFPAQIAERKFTNYSDQREWALRSLDIREEWVLFVDSDERIPPELAEEITSRIGQEPFNGYWIPGRQLLLGPVVAPR